MAAGSTLQHQRLPAFASGACDNNAASPFPQLVPSGQGRRCCPRRRGEGGERGSSPSPATHSARGLIADTLLVLQAALTDVLQADGNIFLHARNDDGDTEQRQEKSMKCTSFVVDKKEHGDTLMDALRVIGLWTSVSGLSSHMQAQEIMPTYIILGNVTSSYQQFVMKTML
ncbi:hypothetical protein C0Q70_05419 [Pomacea canaliculata]|uniref:Uncharacterized protein n=1 Tax=Pomacea canaliculata TaxID=400727 RepID=A0A2T7PL50_POMCA|nr:hypothetical protein C0Q70_05419 [Pomacea canaliculata]